MSQNVKVRNIVIGEGIPKICIPVVGKTEEEILQGIKACMASHADMIEWRADFYASVFDQEKVLHLLKEIREIIAQTVLLFTFRTLEEGGNCAISIDDYKSLNSCVSESGLVDLIDVEINRDTQSSPISEIIAKAHENHVRVILSKHDFKKTPSHEEMASYFDLGNASDADIVKLAVMPQDMNDVLSLLRVTNECHEIGKKPVITMSMSAKGSISRACGEYFGSAVTFGTAGQSSAPGQFDAQKLRSVLDTFHEGIQ